MNKADQTRYCSICGSLFKRGQRTEEQWERSRFCTMVCYAKSNKGKKNPEYSKHLRRLHKERPGFAAKQGDKHWHWKGGRILSSQGYVLIHKPGHPRSDVRGYVREHLLVMEEKIGKPVPVDMEVHHRNRNRTDNRIENLELLTLEQHHAAHVVPRTEKPCKRCGKPFSFLASARRTGRLAPKYCSKVCYIKSKRGI